MGIEYLAFTSNYSGTINLNPKIPQIVAKGNHGTLVGDDGYDPL